MYLRFFNYIVSDFRKTTNLWSFGCLIISRWSKFLLPRQSIYSVEQHFHRSFVNLKESPLSNKKDNQEIIQLLGVNGERRGNMKLKKAQEIAKEENLKLFPVNAENRQIQTQVVYRLVTGEEFSLEERKLKIEKRKPVKLLRISSNISSHDLGIKITQILDWLTKDHEVKIMIKTDASNEGIRENQVFDKVTSSCKELAMVQSSKRTGKELMFQLQPKSEVNINEDTATEKKQKPFKLDDLKKMRNATDADDNAR